MPRQSNKRTLGGAITQALVLFGMLCGLILIVVPSPQDAETEHRDTALPYALESIQKAGQALDASNYGELRLHLQRASDSISKAMASQPK